MMGTWGDSSHISDVTRCLARHSDDIPQVRLTVLEVATKLAMQMPDRYSFWLYILPCILPWSAVYPKVYRLNRVYTEYRLK